MTTTSSNAEMPQRSLIRKQSARQLAKPQPLSSSEMEPSEHSSLYDAAPLTPSSQPVQSYSWHSENGNEDVLPALPESGAAGLCEQAHLGKHVGTRLFTIIEQKSVPSLKTMPSSWEFQRRTFTLQPQLSSEVAQARHSRTARRRCYSADDSTPRTHNKSDFSNDPSVDAISESRSPGRSFACQPNLPIKPPYRPPERIQTPTGLPRWPGERDHDEIAIRQLTVRTSRRDLLREYLRRPTSRPKLREVLRGERTATFDRAVRTGTRFWRPPSSGQSTRRYEDLESHPFSFVPIAKPVATRREQHAIVDEAVRTNLDSGMHNPFNIRNVREATDGQSHAVTDSLRALRCASQNAVPVPLRRASAQASARSAAVPVHIRPPPLVESVPEETSQSPDMSTMRTADLFESFPSPPGQQLCHQQAQPRKRCAWSLFPTSGRNEDGEDHPPRPQRRQAPVPSDESEAINVAIRGESQARYRQSGTPIYDPDGVSLRTVDRGSEGSNEGGHSDPERIVLPKLGHRTESQRAISNGALRFSTRFETTISETPPVSTPPRNTENQAPNLKDLPEPHPLCKHKLAKLRKKHPHLVSTTYDTAHLDGASSPVVQPPPIVAQDYAITGPSISTRARASIAPPVQHLDRPPTTTTFVTAPNGATTFTTSPTMGPFGRSTNLERAQTSSTMPGRA